MERDARRKRARAVVALLVIEAAGAGACAPRWQARTVLTGNLNVGPAPIAAPASDGPAVVPGGQAPELQLVWRDRSGRREPLAALPEGHWFPRLSPDGRRIAIGNTSWGENHRVFIYDIGGTTFSRLTERGSAGFPLWAPDGRWLVMSYENEDGRGLAWIPADGSAEPAWLCKSRQRLVPFGWTPDGKTLILVALNQPGRPHRIQLLSVGESRDARPRPWNTATPQSVSTGHPELSPDGRWLAYTTSEMGRSEVYVEALEAPGTRRRVSRDGGMDPRWAPDGRELYYVEYHASGMLMMAVEVRESGELAPENSRALFEGRWAVGFRTMFDISPDGRRFLLVEPR